jgi:hypothetical protein
MGWTYMKSLGGHAGPKRYLDAQLSFEQPSGRNDVLRSALVRMRVYYAAVEHVANDGSRHVWAAICLVNYNRRARDGYVLGYKDMSEDMGPYEAECPVEILHLLAPTESKNANEWREKCRKFAGLKAENARKPKLEPGQFVEFDYPIYMTDRTTHKTLQVVRPENRRVIFRSPETGDTYAISNVKQRAYKILDQSA